MCSIFKLTPEEERQVKELERWVEKASKSPSYYELTNLEMTVLEIFIGATIFVLGMIVQKEFNF